MMKLSKLTDYAVVIMVVMGQRVGEVFTTQRLADETGVPQPTVAKLVKLLSKGGLLVSQRGANGGYRLDTDPEELSVARVIAAVEGPIALTACVEGTDDSCTVEHLCGMRGNWNKVNGAIEQALQNVTLADMSPAPVIFPPAGETSRTSPASALRS